MEISWDDCVQECFSSTSCMLAYGNSSLLCALYNIGDVKKIRNDKEASEALEKVSFKIDSMYRRDTQPVANIQVTCGYHISNSQLAGNQRSPKKQFLSRRQW
ncbi:unnamed protein product [Caenorhabditis nigoni]